MSSCSNPLDPKTSKPYRSRRPRRFLQGAPAGGATPLATIRVTQPKRELYNSCASDARSVLDSFSPRQRTSFSRPPAPTAVSTRVKKYCRRSGATPRSSSMAASSSSPAMSSSARTATAATTRATSRRCPWLMPMCRRRSQSASKSSRHRSAGGPEANREERVRCTPADFARLPHSGACWSVSQRPPVCVTPLARAPSAARSW
mmetsp:Transcript_32966/g.97929  ORF Transcript_32966/g.97929 Transcript_32966/m.97929 type:complete len:203 (+) Transcript_32966:2494-3102(+)